VRVFLLGERQPGVQQMKFVRWPSKVRRFGRVQGSGGFMSISMTRAVWFLGLAALVGSAACDDGGNGHAPGGNGQTSGAQFTVDWSLAYVGSGDTLGPATTCELAGTPTVELAIFNRTTKDRVVDTFPCNNTGGRSRPLPAGDYDLTITLKSQAGTEISKQEGTFTLGRYGLTPLTPIVFPIQSFLLKWSLARGQVSLACQDVDAKFVNLNTRLNSEDQVTYSFPCPAGSGATPAIQLGTYSVGIDLVNSANAVLWRSDLMTVSVDENMRADLGTVTFQLP
jgi:hypothetical protein